MAAAQTGCAAMLLSTITLIILSLCLGTAAWLTFVWAVGRDQLDDPEGPKYRMLFDDDEADAPAEDERDTP